jgi:uncharacterized protein YecE (DUF72 family)
MTFTNDQLKIGTCSWNYESWVGLVYSQPHQYAAEYLKEYSQKYSTVEIDSWFYKVPDPYEVDSYVSAVGNDFVFSCKAPQKLTQVFDYGTKTPNKHFLSIDLFERFYNRIEPVKDKISIMMLEFEYLNKEKMAGLDQFIEKLDAFIKQIPRNIKIGIECRNKNYLNTSYFDYLKSNDLVHVFSEKQYMPSVCELIDDYVMYLSDSVVVRLLGGDRKEMEKRTSQQWNKIVDEKDVGPVVLHIQQLLNYGKTVTLNINNHYEGSAPITIKKILNELSKI